MKDPWWYRVYSRSVAIGFDVCVRALYEIEVRGLENFTRSPSTLVVASHRRDADGPIVGSVLAERRGLKFDGILPFFVAREDLFERGFLRDYLENWPAVMRWSLSVLNIRSVLRAAQAYPMRRIPEQTLGKVLTDLLHIFGDLPLDGVLRPHWVEAFERIHARRRPLHLSEALRWRYRSLWQLQHGLRKLTLPCFKRLKPYERRTIEAQLRLFSGLLKSGATVLLEPEGVVSADGQFARPRAALHTLLKHSGPLTRVLPIGITYDFMTTGRQKVFVNIGPEMLHLQELGRREIDTTVSKATLSRATVTASQLASRLVLTLRAEGGGTIDAAGLYKYVRAEARKCAANGAYVDPRLLVTEECKRRMILYIDYCLRAGTLVKHASERYGVRNPASESATHWPDGGPDYANNELASLTRLWDDLPRSVGA